MKSKVSEVLRTNCLTLWIADDWWFPMNDYSWTTCETNAVVGFRDWKVTELNWARPGWAPVGDCDSSELINDWSWWVVDDACLWCGHSSNYVKFVNRGASLTLWLHVMSGNEWEQVKISGHLPQVIGEIYVSHHSLRFIYSDQEPLIFVSDKWFESSLWMS